MSSIKIWFKEEGIQDILILARQSSEVLICSASVTPKAFKVLNEECHAPKKTFIFGMFSSDVSLLSPDIPVFASKNGWKVGLDSNLHAKVSFFKRNSSWFVIIGSSNLSFSTRLEFNVILEYGRLPRELKELKTKLESKILDNNELLKRTAPTTLLKGNKNGKPLVW